MTLDGFCDHSVIKADDELHQHYTDLLNGADTLLYGRITYELMEYWPTVQANPTGNKATDDFAAAIDKISKVVFSRSLKHLEWKSARLASKDLEEEIPELGQQPGRDILIESPSMIVQSMNLGLVDEFQICIQPTIVGKGLALLKNVTDRIDLKLLRTKTLSGTGSVVNYYEVVRN